MAGVISKGRSCCLVKFSTLLQGRGPCPEQGKMRGRKQQTLGSAQGWWWKTKLHFCKPSFPLGHWIKVLAWGAVWKRALGCLAVCPAQQLPEGSSWVLLLEGDLQSAVENIIERNIQHGDAAFKVFVQSGICAAKCDIVAKVTACLLFGKSKRILNIGKL